MARSKLTFETLLMHAAGELPGERAAELEQHLAASPQDAARLAHLRELIAAMRTDDSVAPSRQILERAYALFKPRRLEVAAPWWETLARVVAACVFDSRLQPTLAGFRGGDDGFQLAYESQVADVDLQCEPTAASHDVWRVMGQITLKQERPAQLTLVARGEAQIVQAEPDEFGVFTLQTSAGAYEILVRVGDQVVTLGQIELS